MTVVSSADATEPIEPIFSKELVRIRKHLLILVGIQWAICVVIFAVRIYYEITENDKTQSFVSIFALTLYYTCGFIFIYKYHPTGILLFTSIGVILFLIGCLFVLYILLIIIVVGIDYNPVIAVQFFVIFGSFIGFGILTLDLAFQMMESIKLHEDSVA